LNCARKVGPGNARRLQFRLALYAPAWFSANLYSLVETAKANGVEPFAYLSFLFERLPYLKTVEDFEAVLPWAVNLPARR